MLEMNLREMILCASLQQQLFPEEVINAVKLRVKTHPEEVNQPGLLGFTPCHLAVIGSHPALLEILVLEGKGDLSLMSEQRHTPRSLATSQSLQRLLSQLEQEADRRQACKEWHLHDLLRNRSRFTNNNEFEAAIRQRVATFPFEVNEKTYLGRNAIHWCAYYGHSHLIPIIKELFPGAQIDVKDAYQLTPAELIPKQPSHAHTEIQGRVLTRSRRNTSFAAIDKREKEQEKDVAATPRISQFPKVEEIPTSKEESSDEFDLVKEVAKLKLVDIPDDPRGVYLRPLLKKVNARREAFLVNFIKEGYPLVEFEMLGHRSLLSYAFHEGIDEIFSSLLTEGVSIRRDRHLEQERAQVIELLRTDNRRRLIVVSRNNVLEKLNWDHIKRMRIEIIRFSTQFNELLNQYGLEQTVLEKDCVTLTEDMLKTMGAVKLMPWPLIKDLYEICSCFGTQKFDPDEIANRVAGLSAKYNPLQMIAGLIKLQPELGKAQKLVLLYVVKELITHTTELNNQDFRLLSSIAIPALFKTREHKEFLEILRMILFFRSNALETQLDNFFFVDSLIAKHVKSQGQNDFSYQFQLTREETSKRAVGIASALRAHSLMLFHNLNVKELTSYQWKTANKEQAAPSVCDIENYFNRLSNWVTAQILQHSDLKLRSRYLKLCIKVIYELVESEAADYTSAMAIFSAINQAPITRLVGSFALLDRKTKKTLAYLDAKLSPHKNYRMMRESLDQNAYAIPYFGLVTSDLTFAQENREENKTAIVGKVVRHLLQKKHHLDLLHLPRTANLGAFIQQVVIVSDDDLFLQSLRLEPRPLTLNAGIDFAELQQSLNTIKRNGVQLKVMLHGVALEDKAAFEPLIAWLKEQYLQDKFTLVYFADVATLAHSIVWPGVPYKFNEAYYHQLKGEAPAIVVQFNQQQRRRTSTAEYLLDDPDRDIVKLPNLRQSKQ